MTVPESTSWLPASWFAAVSGRFHHSFCLVNGRTGGECQGIGQYMLYQSSSQSRTRPNRPGNAMELATAVQSGQIQHPSNCPVRSRECPSKIGGQLRGSGETSPVTLRVTRAVTGCNQTGGEGVSPPVAPYGNPGSGKVRTRGPPFRFSIGPTPVPPSTIPPYPVVKVNGVFDPVVPADSLDSARSSGNGGHGPQIPDGRGSDPRPVEAMEQTTPYRLNLTPSRMNNGVQ